MEEIKMETIETRKGKMPVVKLGLLAGLLLIGLIGGCATILSPQKVIKGELFEKYPPIGIGTGYQFTDSTFTSITASHLGMKQYFGGSYRIAGDTLILDYEPFKKIESSTYRIKTREPIAKRMDTASDTLGSVRFRIVNRKDKPIRSAHVGMFDSTKTLILGYVADSLGRVPKQFFTDRLHNIYIGFVGRHAVTIPADTLAGYDSEVEVMLTGTTYSHYDGVNKYLIKEVDKNRIVLQPLSEEDIRDRMVLVREGTGD